jgi:hypothetical protein
MNKVDDAIPAITTAKIEQSGSGIFLRVVGINLENGPAGLTVVCAGRRVAFQAVTIEDEGLAVRGRSTAKRDITRLDSIPV